MTRFFRATSAVYESIRSQLDASCGYPNAETKTLSVFVPAAEAPRDLSGMVYLAVGDEYCNYTLPAEILASAITAGTVEELSAEGYVSAVLPDIPDGVRMFS